MNKTMRNVVMNYLGSQRVVDIIDKGEGQVEVLVYFHSLGTAEQADLFSSYQSNSIDFAEHCKSKGVVNVSTQTVAKALSDLHDIPYGFVYSVLTEIEGTRGIMDYTTLADTSVILASFKEFAPLYKKEDEC